MQQVDLIRAMKSVTGTFGILIVDNIPVATTCEPPTPMPVGTYQLIPHNSPTHPNVWEIANVPGHTAVLIHNGNTIEDTILCVLVGLGFGILSGRVSKHLLPAITESDLAIIKLRSLIHLPAQITISESAFIYNTPKPAPIINPSGHKAIIQEAKTPTPPPTQTPKPH